MSSLTRGGAAGQGALGATGRRRRATRASHGRSCSLARLGRLLGLGRATSGSLGRAKSALCLPQRGYARVSTNEALEACGDGAGGVGRARVVIGHRARRDAARWRARRRASGWLRRVSRAQEGAGRGLGDVCGADAPGKRPISKETAIAGLDAESPPGGPRGWPGRRGLLWGRSEGVWTR